MKEVMLGITQVFLLVIFIFGCWQMVKCLGCNSGSEFFYNILPRIAGTWLAGHLFCVIEERYPKREINDEH